MSHLRFFTSIGVVACALVVGGCPKSTEFDPKAGAEEAATSAVLETLGPAGDAVQVLKESPALAKTGLIAHFQRRAKEAALNGDWDGSDWYQAHVDCLGGNCGELTKLQNARRAAARQSATPGRSSGVAPSRPSGSTTPSGSPRVTPAAPPTVDRFGEGGGGGGGGSH